jgi:hypothetical protein
MVHPDYPEHAKLALIADKSQVVGEFLDWCQSEKGLHLVNLGDYRQDGMPVPFRPLLAEFFEIDEDAIEREKRLMLERLREQNEKVHG